MAYQPVENLIVWRRSKDLAVEMYKATAHWTDFDLKSQMRRASVSIPSNIAEGYERGSSAEKGISIVCPAGRLQSCELN